MCSYCGCDALVPVGRFMAEHAQIVTATGALRRATQAGDEPAVRARAGELAALLHPHTAAEEAGLFAVLRREAEFAEHVDALCGEHAQLDALLSQVATGRWDLVADLERALRRHIDREDNGLFPAAAIALDGPQWEEVVTRTPPDRDHTPVD